MNKEEIQAQLIENCDAFSEFTKKQIRQFLEVEMTSGDTPAQTPQIEEDHDLFFSVLFSGSVYGEFIFGMNRKVALKLLDDEAQEDGFEQMKDDIFDTFKEIINISAAQSLKQLDKKFDQLTITSPKITLGSFILPPLPLYCKKLSHKNGFISCYLYIDTMRLNLAKSFDSQKAEIEEKEQKNQQLKKLNEAKSEFLANMSHELRTPLNGMIGTLEVIKQTELSSIQRNQLNIIEQSGDFLLGIINDILEFSKIESGKFTVETRDFKLIECIEKTVKVIANQVYKKDLELFIDIQPEVPDIFCSDETRLKQLLINLIGNAIKFTPKGVIKLTVSKQDQFLKFDVKDNGVGIPKNKLKTIFESFSQADVSDNRKYGGSGLGLTICKAIVSALQGQLSVESEEAVGTTFTFTLPIPESQAMLAPRPVHNHKLLMVSNNDLLIENMKNQIESLKVGHIHVIDFSRIIESIEAEQEEALALLLGWKEWTQFSEKEALVKACQSKNIPIVFLMKPDAALELSEYEKLLDDVQGKTISFPAVQSDVLKLLEKNSKFVFAKQIKSNNLKKVELSKCNRILLVEDNPVNQVVATTMLESLGLSIEVASNGEEALEKYQSEEPFDLILMDCQMPVLNGFEAAAKIRELEADKEHKTPIIALTASAFRETKERCYESGMDDFVTKPFKIETIQAAIKKNSG